MVRPVTGFAAVPFVLLGPATSIRIKDQSIQRTGATTATEARPDQPDPQCEGVISIA